MSREALTRNCDEIIHPLSLFFDLATDLAVPRISKHVTRLMWPVLTGPKEKQFEELANVVSRPRFDCRNERWPFFAGAEKVVSVAKAIADLGPAARPEQRRELALCYVGEYYHELIFQRLFAWAVYRDTPEAESASQHFHYRNAYANARAVLATPLLVDLAGGLEAVVGQGNFGYKSSRYETPWIYPHLSHYLSAFYFPWVPDVEIPRASEGAALDRAVARSTSVCRELYHMLSELYRLHYRGDPARPEPDGAGHRGRLPGVVNEHFEVGRNEFLSDFVRHAVLGRGMPCLKSPRDAPDDDEAAATFFAADLQVPEVVSRVEEFVDGRDGREAPLNRLLQTCKSDIQKALRRELGGAVLADPDPGRLKEFCGWRFLEERLRLVVDRLLLARRFYDPPVTRTGFSSKFENIGVFAVEIPEIHFNLEVEALNCRGMSYNDQGTRHDRRREQWTQWIAQATDLYKRDKEKLWATGVFPRHAIFETYLMDGAGAGEAFRMGLTISHLVPSLSPETLKYRNDRNSFIARLKQQADAEPETRPFSLLPEICRCKGSERGTDFNKFGQDLGLWKWVAEKLSKIFGVSPEALADLPVGRVIKVLDERPAWPDPLAAVAAEDLAAASAPEPRRGEDDEQARREKEEEARQRREEASEMEERGRLFFSYEAFFGVNTPIFSAFTDRDYARNFITLRLIAAERAADQTAALIRSQDHADFVGTYVIWQGGEDGRPRRQGGRRQPRLDAWHEDCYADCDVGDGDGGGDGRAAGPNGAAQGWLSQLHRQKLLIKNLGVSLLNHERLREQERLNALVRRETTRSTIAGIMARNMSHNIGSHVLASSDLLKDAHRAEVQKLHNYLQQRMDFIAQVVTYTPSWGEPTFFLKDLLKGFFDQYLLLSNLIKDQGYEELRFTVTANVGGQQAESRSLVFTRDVEFRCDNEECGRLVMTDDEEERCRCGVKQVQRCSGGWVCNDESADGGWRDFLVAIPGGAIGAHAFYIIIENILRNSAKYGRQQKDGLDMHIHVREGRKSGHEEEFYLVEISDNTGARWDEKDALPGPDGVKRPPRCGAGQRCGVCRVCIVRAALEDELIHPITGAVSEKSRGVHEMKECATILINPHLHEFGRQHMERYHALWVDAADTEEPERWREDQLVYSFVLQKPRLVGIVDSPAWQSRVMKSAGVFHHGRIDDLARYSHQAGIVYLPPDASRREVLRYIAEHHYLLPYRLLVVDEAGTGEGELREIAGHLPLHLRNFPARRLQWCRELARPREDSYAAWQDFVLGVYELWLRKFKPLPEGRKWHLLVAFDRPARHAAFKRWRQALVEFRSEMLDVHLIAADRRRKFVSVEHSPDPDLTRDDSRSNIREALRRKIEAAPDSWVVYDNHGAGVGRSILVEDKDKETLADRRRLRAYNDFGSGNIRLYQTLESPPLSEFGFRFFALGLLEAGLANVVIVDERVAEASYDKEKGFGKNLLRQMREARCYPLYSIWAAREDGGKRERKFVSDTIEQRSLELGAHATLWPQAIHPDEGLKLDPDPERERAGLEPDAPTIQVHVPSILLTKSKVDKLEEGTVDVVIIHQGVIDVLQKNGLWRGEGHEDQHLHRLHRLSPSVVITSGRGRTIRHVENKEIPFVEFSIIKDNTYGSVSKYHIVRAVFSVSGESGGEPR